MADETEQLIVQLEAKVDNFEKQMKKAAAVADQGFGSIEAIAIRPWIARPPPTEQRMTDA